MKKSRGFDKSIIFLVFIILIVLIVSTFLFFRLRSNEILNKINDEKSINILFSVYDDSSENKDLIFSNVFFYNTKTKNGAIMDLPNNVASYITSIDKNKEISILYNYKNVDRYREEVSKLLNTEIEYHINISLSNLCDYIDLIGGVAVFLSEPMEIINEDKISLLPTGNFVLDGFKIKPYFYYLNIGDNDDERISKILKLTNEIYLSLGDKSNNFYKSFGFKKVREIMDTNINKKGFKALINELAFYNSSNVIYSRIYGKTIFVDDKELLFPNNLLRSVVQNIFKAISDTNSSVDIASVKVQILNGTKINNLAEKTGVIYKSFGYNVMPVKNADRSDYKETIVIDNFNNEKVVNDVADIIRCENIERSSFSVDNLSNITIILGSDYDGRYCR